MEIKEAYRGFNDALQIQKEALENVEKDIVTFYFLASGEIESTDEDHGGLPAERERVVHQL